MLVYLGSNVYGHCIMLACVVHVCIREWQNIPMYRLISNL